MIRRLSLIFLLIGALALGGCSSKRAAAGKSGGGTSTTARVIPSTDKQVNELIRQARSWIGTPYVYGGHTRKKGTDCSGMIMELFLSVYDLKLPRSSAMQREFARPVAFKDMVPGDLVFFSTGKNASRVNHVGLYIGDNRMIHASGSRGVMESNLGERYWQRTFHSSGHIIETDTRKQNRKPEKKAPAAELTISAKRLQQLYDALDEQIDSIYVADPEIFD